MSKRPDQIVHSDETVLRVMRCETIGEVRTLVPSLGVSFAMAGRWYYRTQARAVRLAEQYGIPSRIREHARPKARRTGIDLIRAVMAGDA